jgi:hypothetical protein
MAHLWVNVGKEGWALAELGGDAFVLAAQANRPVRVRRPSDCVTANAEANGAAPSDQRAREAVLLRSGAGDRERWVLLAAPSKQAVAVNGLPLATGLRVLHDRDEIRVPGAPPMFFSTERLARVEPYAGPPHGRCSCCDAEIQQGRPSVRCPQCRMAYHQDPAEGLECWTYRPTCLKCAQPTGLDLDYAWTPEGL